MKTTVSGETLSRVDRQIFAASFAQQQFWVLDQLKPDSAINTIAATVYVSKPLSTSALAGSLNMLVQRHEVLRTTFDMIEGQLVQVIAPSLTIPLVVSNLQQMPEAEQRVQVEHLVTEQSQQAFDLTQGPLVRVSLLQLADEEHVLLLSMHRIVCDDWSVGVLVRDLACLYEICSSGEPSPLAPLPYQYSDFARWQLEELAEEILAQHLAYWKQQLAGVSDTLQLPADYPRPAVATLRGSVYQTVLPSALTQALQDLSRQQGVSLDITLVAAFQTLLYRYTSQEDLLIGTITPARRRKETEALIGACENILMLRTDLSGHPRFADLLGRVREVIEVAQAHEDLPFESLIKELHVSRSLGLNPLFQVLLRLPRTQPALPSNWKLEQVTTGMGTSQFDLTLDLQEGPQGLISRFIYSTDLFEEETIARMAGHWQILLEGIVAEPSRQLVHLPLLTSQERSLLLEEWTATQQAYPLELCVHQLFEAQVQRSPEAVAVIYEGEQVSYQELNRQANLLAHYLRTQGVGPDTLVALLAERSIPFVVAILAVFKAGGAYLPLDPHHPEGRLRQVIEQSRCKLVLTTAPFVATLSQVLEEIPKDIRPHDICLKDVPHASQREANLPLTSTPADLAYVIYTSGSTGLPKGAMVEQRGMINHLFAKIEALDLTAADSVAQTASQCFDISVWQFLAALLVGGRIQIYPDVVAHDAVQLLQQVEQQEVSILETVPSLLRAMLDAQESAGSDRPKLEALRWLIPTGEALPVELCRRWLKSYPHVPLINAYGPTECSDDVTHYVIDQQPEEGQRSIPIGRAIPNMRLYVLDRSSLEPLPIGVSGELYVAGIGVGRGYLGDEQRTAEAFITDPFVPAEGARLYKTGDLGRYLPDGNLEFLGRVDSQVKVRGNRIELGEIEAVLGQLAGVREVVVVVREDMPGEQRLVAYVVLHQEPSVTLEELKRQLMKQVPNYMVPSAFVLLEQLPLTSNGKLDRKALPVPERSRNERPQRYIPPVEPLHRQLAVIWEDLLGVCPIGMQDDFFELGGNSLLAVQLFERIAQLCGKRLSLSVLFAGATIEYVAQVLQEGSQKIDRAALVVVQTGGTKRPFFFLHGQWRGGAFYSRELARRMGSDQPFYLLEPYKFDGLAVPPSFEEMAVAHLETLRRVQPEGPYLLGGWCNGGLMAYEMARQLREQGQTVELLVMMDPDAPATPFKRGRRIMAGLGSLLGLSREKQTDWFLLYRHLRLSFHYWRLNLFKDSRTALQDRPELEPGLENDDVSPELAVLIPTKKALRQDWLGVLDWVISGYMHHSYPGKITFFWAEKEVLRKERWRKLIEDKDVDIHMIPGNHTTSRTEYLPVLAEHLYTCLSKVHE
jgi:amino acid adenylation domain-containing protein